MIGTRVGHFEITAHLGSGGMGDVYKATDTKLRRRVAIKLLPEAFASDSERVARFEREARVLAEAVSEAGVSGIVGWIFRVMAAIGCISGLFLLQWAWQERIHLNKPDPEKPLSIKDRK